MRLHDSTRILYLRRALFSLVCQDYRPLSIYIVTQRFSESEVRKLHSDLCTTLALDPLISFKVLNYSTPEPGDARSALMNLGIRATTGRYLAFLDYDDVIYPTAYSRLIDELQIRRCAIAFGKVLLKRVDVFEDTLIVERREQRFVGKNVLDLFRANFCPIHSFVIDRSKLSDNELWFDESLSRAEDYEFLLRICAVHEASFLPYEKAVGDYFYRNDGTNTVLLTSNPGDERPFSWKTAEDFLEQRRRTLNVSAAVQHSLGIRSSQRNLTIRDILHHFDE